MVESSSSELEALKRGDEATFVDLIRRYHGPMLRLAMAYVRDHHVAEDVVQESWLTAIKSLDRFEGRSALKTWIFGIVINLARARRRKEWRVLTFTALLRRGDPDGRQSTVDASRFTAAGDWRATPSQWENIPEAKLLGREAMQRVQAAIQKLPPKHREVILLRDVAELEAGPVSELLGISAENQRVRLHRARAAVRKSLEDYLG